MKLVLQRIVNSLIWMVSGVIVIIIRALIIQTSAILIWEILGLGMIAYGAAKLLLVLARGAPTGGSMP